MANGNLYKSFLEYLNKAANITKTNPNIVEILKSFARILNFNLTIKMDNGEIRNFEAYRVQHNNARGPFKGGIRYHSQVNLAEIKGLAGMMTFKGAIANIPMGGAKGGIVVDPKKLSLRELERLSRAYIRASANYIGPDIDVPAPDMYTNAQIMAWMMDEYSQLVGKHSPAVITGKPIELGGSLGRETSTGYGAFFIFEELLKKLKWNAKKTTVIIQGVGNVGYNFAKAAEKAGVKIIGMSDSQGGIYSPDRSLDVDSVINIKKSKGMIDGCYCRGSVCDCDEKSHKHLSNEQLLTKPCDILVPAALENQITGKNAGKIKAKVILEIANGPTTPEAQEKLNKRKILVVPDILANAGGVTVSYFEWVQNNQGLYWTEKEVNDRMKNIMIKSFNDVWETKEKYQVDMRTAAYVLALEKISYAMELRGIK